MGRCRGRGPVRNSRFCRRFESKVWRERCSFRARFASVVISAGRHTIPLQSRARRGCFLGPRFWSLAGHTSQHRNRAQSHRSTVQRQTALTPAKGGRVLRETAASHRAQATLSHRNSVRAPQCIDIRPQGGGRRFVPSLPIRLQATVVLPTTNHQECSLMALQPPRMASSRVTRARMAVKE